MKLVCVFPLYLCYVLVSFSFLYFVLLHGKNWSLPRKLCISFMFSKLLGKSHLRINFLHSYEYFLFYIFMYFFSFRLAICFIVHCFFLPVNLLLYIYSVFFTFYFINFFFIFILSAFLRFILYFFWLPELNV